MGENAKDNDIVVNVTKSKKLTNMRASGADDKARIVPPWCSALKRRSNTSRRTNMWSDPQPYTPAQDTPRRDRAQTRRVKSQFLNRHRTPRHVKISMPPEIPAEVQQAKMRFGIIGNAPR